MHSSSEGGILQNMYAQLVGDIVTRFLFFPGKFARNSLELESIGWYKQSTKLAPIQLHINSRCISENVQTPERILLVRLNHLSSRILPSPNNSPPTTFY